MEQKRKKSLLGIALMVAIIVVSANLGPKFLKPKEKKVLADTNILREKAKTMNKDCPFIVDENTRLDSITSPKRHIIQNNYTLLNDNLVEIDINHFEDVLKPEIINHLISSKESEFFQKNNATLIYKYFDKEKNYITDITILPQDYR